jgi:hypothetical protein
MTEKEWLESHQSYEPLLHVRSFSSVRKLRLVAAAFARWLESLPGYEEARPCADIIEEVADDPKPYSELETGSMRFLAGVGPCPILWLLMTSRQLDSHGEAGMPKARP